MSRIGLRSAHHSMKVNFRNKDKEFLKLALSIQKMYRNGMFTQMQLSQIFNLTPTLINKICRCQFASKIGKSAC